MSKPKLIALALIVMIAVCVGASAQSTKHYDKDGLSFDYPSNWAMQDSSDTKQQYLVFAPPNSDLQITVFAFRTLIENADEAAQAKTGLIDTHIARQTTQMKQMGMTPTRTDDTATIGGAAATATHLRGSLDGSDGESGIYWATVNKRVVIITTFGPDQDLKRLATQLEALRTSLAIAAPAAAPAKP